MIKYNENSKLSELIKSIDKLHNNTSKLNNKESLNNEEIDELNYNYNLLQNCYEELFYYANIDYYNDNKYID